jgi:glycosyltransferase involved in cell wall biosynthesis
MNKDRFPLVSALFITYKRYDLLKHAVLRFRENTDYPNLEIVIADDGSSAEVQTKIRTLPADVFALQLKNRGLGANNNNGLRHCTGKYILMIQDDCMCYGPRDYLRNTILVMEANPDVGIINYYGPLHPVDGSHQLAGCDEPCYITPEPYKDGTKEYFLYTDQPHVVSRAAMEHVGYYLENRNLEACEEDYTKRWRDQARFATAVFPSYYMKTFAHEGNEQSFRTNRLRYRIDASLMPVAIFFKRHCTPLYKIGRATIRATVGLAEKVGIVR